MIVSIGKKCLANLRVMMFECLPGLCVLGEQCGNQRVQSQSIDKDLKVVEVFFTRVITDSRKRIWTND